MEEQVKAGSRKSLLARITGSLRIRGKIILGFVTILLLTVIISAVALVGQQYNISTVNEMLNVHNRIAQLSLSVQTDVDNMFLQDAAFRLNYATQGLQEAKKEYFPKFFEAEALAQEKIITMSTLMQNQQDRELIQEVLEIINSFSASFLYAANSLDQKFDHEIGLLARLAQALKEIEDFVEAPGTPIEAALLFRHLESLYTQYLANPSPQVTAGAAKAINKFKEGIGPLIQGKQQIDLTQYIDAFANLFDGLLKADEDINLQIAAYKQVASQVSPILNTMHGRALANQSQFADRLANTTQAVQYAVLGVSILALLLGLLLAWVISRGLTGQVDKIMDLLSEIGIGHFGARAEVTSQDELGEMAVSLNTMLDSMTMLILSQDERDKEQESFMKLMMEISELTEGNLTVRAKVTEDKTGALADSFNTMAEQFGGIVRQVKGAASAVEETAADVSKLTSELAVRSIEQNNQVNDTIESINSIAESIREVSQNASRSAEVSLASRMNAREGAEAVEQTNRAMDEIREQINETARSIKRLSENSMEIGNVVEIINNIADRTSILALNASIQAAMAGEAGFGFAVVAEEVQRLAESSSNSTKQIDTLIKSIQAEIKDVGNRMDESISKVVQGSQLADGAYAKLQEIESVSNQLADLIESITRSAADQVQRSEHVVESMMAVGEVSTNTAHSTQKTDNLMSVLNNTARQLREAVDAFKIETA
ncbi:MAG: methyl-accepting chemotaxis protein [Desulfobulbaceae bacterium]|nr:methyl-accepting chemotaxis protein [Desulfobulbaceae bacterium]